MACREAYDFHHNPGRINSVSPTDDTFNNFNVTIQNFRSEPAGYGHFQADTINSLVRDMDGSFFSDLVGQTVIASYEGNKVVGLRLYNNENR